jgi:hypothetical protein
MRRARIEECRELKGTNADAELHGVFGSEPRDCVESNERLVLSRLGCIVDQVRCIVDEVRDLEVEEALAFVAADVRLVTIIVETLSAALGHLSGRQATEWPRRLLWRWSERCSLRWRDRGHWRRLLLVASRRPGGTQATGRRNRGAALISTGQRHGTLQVRGRLELNVDANGVRQSPCEELYLLFWCQISSVCHPCLEGLQVLVHGAATLKASEVRVGVLDRQPTKGSTRSR